jgi:hypothetical protein
LCGIIRTATYTTPASAAPSPVAPVAKVVPAVSQHNEEPKRSLAAGDPAFTLVCVPYMEPLYTYTAPLAEAVSSSPVAPIITILLSAEIAVENPKKSDPHHQMRVFSLFGEFPMRLLTDMKDFLIQTQFPI